MYEFRNLVHKDNKGWYCIAAFDKNFYTTSNSLQVNVHNSALIHVNCNVILSTNNRDFCNFLYFAKVNKGVQPVTFTGERRVAVGFKQQQISKLRFLKTKKKAQIKRCR